MVGCLLCPIVDDVADGVVALEVPGIPDDGPVGSSSSSRGKVSDGLQAAALGFGLADRDDVVLTCSRDVDVAVPCFHQDTEGKLGGGVGERSSSAPVIISATTFAPCHTLAAIFAIREGCSMMLVSVGSLSALCSGGGAEIFLSPTVSAVEAGISGADVGGLSCTEDWGTDAVEGMLDSAADCAVDDGIVLGEDELCAAGEAMPVLGVLDGTQPPEKNQFLPKCPPPWSSSICNHKTNPKHGVEEFRLVQAYKEQYI